MRVLVACERSGIVREAFRALGHDAWSNDLVPCDDGSPYHLQGDAVELAYSQSWDLMIAHPPCTYLANSGARWLFEKAGRWQRLDEACAFIRELMAAPIPRKAIENPWPHKWALERIGRPAFKVQPYEHGDRQKKGTFFWTHNLPPILPSEYVGPPPKAGSEEAKAWEACWRCPPGPMQAVLRSQTFPGIARALAAQWGSIA